MHREDSAQPAVRRRYQSDTRFYGAPGLVIITGEAVGVILLTCLHLHSLRNPRRFAVDIRPWQLSATRSLRVISRAVIDD